MVSPDHETRVGAHRVFAVVLVPSSVCPRPHSNQCATTVSNIQRTLSRTVSVFSSSAALFQKMGKENADGKDDNKSMLNRLTSSYSRAYSTRRQSEPITTEETTMSSMDKESVWPKVPSSISASTSVYFCSISVCSNTVLYIRQMVNLKFG